MNIKRIYFATIVWAFMLLGSTCLALENQIINGEFDAGIESWQRSDGDGFTIEVVEDAGLSGTNALKIDVSNAEAQDYIVVSHSDIVIEHPTAYAIDFMAKAQSNREMLVLLKRKQSTCWHELVELTTQPQTFSFKYNRMGGTFTLSFVLKQPGWPGRNENANIDVYIDRVYFGDERFRDPNLVCYPTPLDGAIHPDSWATLSWSPGSHAVSHDVYIGKNIEDVKANTDDTFWSNYSTPWITIGFPDYSGRSIGLMDPGSTIYWCINEVNDLHMDSPWKGDVWSFWLAPYTAYDPAPANGAATHKGEIWNFTTVSAAFIRGGN